MGRGLGQWVGRMEIRRQTGKRAPTAATPVHASTG